MSSQLPNTDSIRELAEFWDRHDLADFEDQLEEVDEPVFQRSEPGVTLVQIALEPREADALDRIARSQHQSREEVLGAWVREQIAQGERR